MLPPLLSVLRFTSMPYVACPNSPPQDNIDANLSGLSPILPSLKAIIKYNSDILGFGGLGMFVVPTLVILNEIGNDEVFVTPTSWDLMKF